MTRISRPLPLLVQGQLGDLDSEPGQRWSYFACSQSTGTFFTGSLSQPIVLRKSVWTALFPDVEARLLLVKTTTMVVWSASETLQLDRMIHRLCSDTAD
jgi:hypothetical protein